MCTLGSKMDEFLFLAGRLEFTVVKESRPGPK
jgi:hypothetical protein